jgi:hypothetical protein
MRPATRREIVPDAAGGFRDEATWGLGFQKQIAKSQITKKNSSLQAVGAHRLIIIAMLSDLAANLPCGEVGGNPGTP